MPKAILPVIAAIPNYNMARSLIDLLRRVLEADYDAVFVLDDNSTDGSQDLVRDLDSSIIFVAGSENLGSGANRNRIIGALQYAAIIHFVDADMQLASDHPAELAREVALSDRIGFVGGLVIESNGRQHPFNYGPRQCLRSDIGANIHAHICLLAETDSERARALRDRYAVLLRDWPDPQIEPQSRQVFWNAESNLLIRSDVLAAVGGFDRNLRCHEIQDLAIRLYRCGLERRFEPKLAAIHKAVVVRTGNRYMQMARAQLQIARKHGLSNWLLPDGKFQPSL